MTKTLAMVMIGVWLFGLLFMAFGVFVGVAAHRWLMVAVDTLCVGIAAFKIARYMRIIDLLDEAEK